MKKLLFFNFLLFITSCDGQSKTNFKEEYDNNASVKESIIYMCEVKNNNIPKDTTDFRIKERTTFDKKGNKLEFNKLTKNETGEIVSAEKRLFSYNGNQTKIKLTTNFMNSGVQKADFEYIWLDRFNFKVVNENEVNKDKNYILTTLNKDFKAVKIIEKLGNIETTEQIERIYKNNRIEKTESTKIIKRDNKLLVNNAITKISKEFDEKNNPTIIYLYRDTDEKKLEAIAFIKYKYY